MNNELITIEKIESMKPNKAIEVLSDYGNIEHIIQEVQKMALAHIPDVSTDKGRKEIGSVANKVSRSKTFLTKCCDDAVKEYKDKISKVNETKKTITEKLDGTRDEVLQPRKDWQEEQDRIEQDRKDEINLRIQNIRQLGQFAETDSVEECSSKIEALEAMDVSSGFYEFAQDAATAIKDAIKALNDRVIFLVQEEQRKKQEAQLLEIQQSQEIDNRLNSLQMIPLSLMGKSLAEIEGKISSLEKFEINEDEFKGRTEEANEKVKVVISQLVVMADQAKQLELISQKAINTEIKAQALAQQQAKESAVDTAMTEMPSVNATQSRLETARQVMKQAETSPVAYVQYAERPDEMISLTMKEYNELMRKADLLDALFAAGVDSWDGYSEAMEMLEAS